jgi:uncharacterized integral membrane protein
MSPLAAVKLSVERLRSPGRRHNVERAHMSLDATPEQRADEGWHPTKKQIVAAIIAVVAVLFIFQNTGTGHFHFLWLDFTAPVWIWLLAVFAGGVATGLLIASRRAKAKAAQA